ncbi:hypothetical protein IKG60_02570 [Candidatus Saccharibacteria bacterium]|nr:hypothetical protein [Candidatus Saccharibacteria bacterium]
MNKDVIYVEPEDDITDIILKIENAKEKIVALVPPKKAGVFRSVVNIKLIAKAGVTSGKKIVLVTVDPSIVRLAATAKLPVTKNLQTPPTIPEVEAEPETVVSEDLVEESDGEIETEEDVEELTNGKEKEEETEKSAKTDTKPKKTEETEDDEEDSDKEDKKKSAKSSKKEKSTNSSNKFVAWFQNHKKTAIASGIIGVLLIVFLVWAFVIAPAATVTVGVKATSNNFSEGVTFTNTLSEENASEGKFYLEEKKVEDIKEVEFEATGKKNIGEKATGEVTVIATIPYNGGTKQVKAGDVFTNDGLSFVADKDVVMSFDGKDTSVCSNVNDDTKIKELKEQGCKIYVIIKVTAAEPGSKYNISARETGWDTTAPVAAYSTSPMSGGTDKEITIVLQSDVLKAKEALAATDENANKEKLLASLSEDALVIESSFKQSTGEAISTPGAGEEVKEGTKPKLKAVTTATINAVDKTKLAEFITKKANLGDNQKIYEMKDPFVENFAQTTNGYTGKLKTTYLTGPRITVASVIDLVKGKGMGDAQHILKDIDGVTDVRIQGSYPWVTSIPDDTNRITVNIDIKDQNGTEVKVDADNEDEAQAHSNSGQGNKDNK